MPKEEWGVKRVCPTTGKRFYDLNRDPIVSPYTGEDVKLDDTKSRLIQADGEDLSVRRATETAVSDDDVVLDDDDMDVELDDDLLEEDDDDNVSLDDIADVSSDEDES
ncbi:MAG: TIGR02300 family protein [Paracoccaceae bacterium]|uniref:TIGR02300 family protein n=1 Tax=Candidatus Salinivivens marinus TaxID=3381703 RepID=UPI000B6F3216|nr:TIGR02300 family protein [Marinovum sp.]OUU13938.1 MAG: TIGR02300 family protein [Rhodobacteraceae bacterium TMED38]PDH61304.1 MAG: TIGR02300 family protein [Rhodobacteraceae bacterium MED-G08]|tara:strand:- start:994 stop:1317 length:324 start_codon:yes stop_codon:yes gene_type:complete